jgi:hypothetical protein
MLQDTCEAWNQGAMTSSTRFPPLVFESSGSHARAFLREASTLA